MEGCDVTAGMAGIVEIKPGAINHEEFHVHVSLFEAPWACNDARLHTPREFSIFFSPRLSVETRFASGGFRKCTKYHACRLPRVLHVVLTCVHSWQANAYFLYELNIFIWSLI